MDTIPPSNTLASYTPSSIASLLSNASNTTISGGSFGTAANGGTVIQGGSVVMTPATNQGLTAVVRDAAAPLAIRNQVGSGVASNGFQLGTRANAIEDIEQWISGEGNLSTLGPVAWLTGPAGCGKSTIVQTLADRRSAARIPVATFFFHHSDTTRNRTQALVATLVYQLAGFLGDTARANEIISSVIDFDPLIFSQPIGIQFSKLVIPLAKVVPGPQPVVLLIDGLDECIPEAHEDVRILVYAIHSILTNFDSEPAMFLKVLFSSRPEAYLAMEFNRIDRPSGTLLRISLDDERYHSEADIRDLVSSCFEEIRNTHPLMIKLHDSVSSQWPSEDAVDRIVFKSSGHVLYAVTAMQIIADPHHDPALQLSAIIAQAGDDSCHFQSTLQYAGNPFHRMDAIFIRVLSSCSDPEWQVLRDILAGQLLLDGIDDKSFNLHDCLAPLNVRMDNVQAVLLQVVSLVRYDSERKAVFFHHLSLLDFLVQKARSGNYHIDMRSFAVHMVVRILKSTDIRFTLSTFKFMSLVLDSVTESNPELISSLHLCPPLACPLHETQVLDLRESFFRILRSIKRLCANRNGSICKTILRSWLGGSKLHFGQHWAEIARCLRECDILPPDLRATLREGEPQLSEPANMLNSVFNFLSPRISAEQAYSAYLQSKDGASLDAAIERFQLAVEKYRDRGSGTLVTTVVNYIIAVWRRYEDFGRSEDDLDKIIRLGSEARGFDWSSGKNVKAYATLLTLLGSAHFEQYQRVLVECEGTLKSEKANQAFESAVQCYMELKDNPEAGDQRSATQIQLGAMMRMRCEDDPSLDGLDSGIQHLLDALSEAIALEEAVNASDKAEDVKKGRAASIEHIKAICLLNLAESYEVRFNLTSHSGNIDDLNTAIRYNQQSKPILERLQHPELRGCMFNLARQLRLLWKKTGDKEDYNRAKYMAQLARDVENADKVVEQNIKQLLDLMP